MEIKNLTYSPEDREKKGKKIILGMFSLPFFKTIGGQI
jgi:hypothetical protein